MPGTPATTPRLGIPRYAPSDLADFPTQANAIVDQVDNASKLLTPPGAVIQFAGSAAPLGWFMCNGQAVSRTAFPDLFAAIGTTYGPGDGSTTFNLPDLEGRVPVGRDPSNKRIALNPHVNLGDSGGVEFHTLTVNEMPAHRHGQTFSNMAQAGTGAILGAGAGSDTSGMASAGGDGAHQNMQPYLILNYIIKA